MLMAVHADADQAPARRVESQAAVEQPRPARDDGDDGERDLQAVLVGDLRRAVGDAPYASDARRAPRRRVAARGAERAPGGGSPRGDGSAPPLWARSGP